MKKVRIRKGKERALRSWWLVDREGNVYYIDTETPAYDGHVDLEKMTLSFKGESPTVSSLISDGWRVETSYDELRMSFLNYEYKKTKKEDIDVEDIRDRFRERGWNASKRALDYCVDAWLKGVGSGFRDNVAGVYTSIDGGNGPLRVTMTTLDDLCKGWQVTHKDAAN